MPTKKGKSASPPRPHALSFSLPSFFDGKPRRRRVANPWVSTLRLRTLPAAASPVLVGGAIAHHLQGFHIGAWLAALVGALLIQVGTNLANDYYDHVKGADMGDRAGPRRASATGDLEPRHVRNAAYATMAAAVLVGVYLVVRGGLPILVIGLAGVASGIFYTKGPRALAYTGAADIFAFAFFGPIAVAGTVYVQTFTWPWQAWAWGVPMGLLTTAILVVNNLRDRPTDERVGKRTLAVRAGDRATQVYWSGLVGAALLAPFAIGHFADQIAWLVPVAAVVAAVSPARLIWGPLGPRAALNPALGGSARVLLVYAVLAAVAIAAT